ncbi:MAG: aspartate-semialdehyde dehydrogenase [Alphaproteobacteria bacterium]|nr:aspartate-semialdehyde dehydrogenase [Alphaproteobacteria bacterium]
MSVSILQRQSTAMRRIHPSPSVAIVGATGAVGAELIGCLERRNFPLSRLKLLASPRSAGRTLTFQGRDVVIDGLTPMSFDGVDVALFAAGSGVSKDHARRAAADGTIVIDNSSAFRMDDDVPLVVPEVNADTLGTHHNLIANPNCTAAISVMALWPLYRENKIRRVIAATYQAASGAGAAAMEELRASTEAHLTGRAYEPRVLPHPYAFNIFSHNDTVDLESGENGEEIKAARELRKLMCAPDLRVGITCVRVPVFRAHTIAMTVEFERPLSPDQAREILGAAPGVDIVDDRNANRFPMPRDATGRDNVLVGRFRADKSDPTGHSLALMVAGDQLLKGAALNAVQIAEALMK